jgi:antitoxin PrlF
MESIMAQPILVSESTLTDRYQTTIPDTVRKALHLKKKDKICFTIASDGNVLLTRAEVEEDDPVLGEFLAFLANDIVKNPAQIKPLTIDMKTRGDVLIEGVEFDIDSPLLDEDE